MPITITSTAIYDDAVTETTHQKTGLSTGAGKLLILAIATLSNFAFDGTPEVTGVTDSAGNTWTRIVSSTVAFSTEATIWATGNAAAAITTFTIATADSVGTVQSQFYEISGAGAVDVSHAGTPANNTSPSSGSSGTPAGAADLAIGCIAWFGTATVSANQFSPFGAGTEVTRSNTSHNIAAGSAILASATAQTYQATLNASNSWTACVALWQAVPDAFIRPAHHQTQAVMRSANW